MTEELFPLEQADAVFQQGDPVVQPPKKDPYKKKVWGILSSNFEDFKLSEDDFYKKLAADKTYANKVYDVLASSFEDFSKPKDKFIVDIYYEEPVKKKDGTKALGFSQYDFLNVGKPSSLTPLPLVGEYSQVQEPKAAPKVEEPIKVAPLIQVDETLDPIQLAQKTTKIETGKDDPYSVKLARGGFGDDWTESVKDLPKGYENHELFGTSNLLKQYKENPVGFARTVSSLKWQTALASAMLNKKNQIFATNIKNPKTENDVRYNEQNQVAIDNINDENQSFIDMQSYTGAGDKKQHFQQIVNLINKYIDNDEDRRKAIDNLRVDRGIDFGSLNDFSKFNKLQAEGSSKGLNAYELMGYDYLKYIDPQQAEFFRRTVMDIGEGELDATQFRAYEKNKRDLEKIGMNVMNSHVKEGLDSLIAKSKANGGVLSDSDYKLAQKYQNELDRIGINSNIIDSQVQNNNEDIELESAAQEAAGQRFSTPKTLYNILVNSFSNTGSGILHYIKSPVRMFQDESSSNRDLLTSQGMDMFTNQLVNLTSEKGLYKNSRLDISPELQDKIDQVKLSGKSQEEIIDDVKKLMSSNRDKWRTVKAEGSFNITPLSVATSVTRLGAEITPYIILEAVSGGGSTEGLVSKLAKTWAAVALTSYEGLVQSAMRNKDPNPEATALADITINTIAFTVGGIPSKIRAKAGTNTVVGKLINKMDDATIMKALEKRPKVLTDYLLQYGKRVGNAVVSSSKSAASMQAALAGAEILKGADVNSDFAKEQISQFLNFTLFGAIGLSAKKTPDFKAESRDALYLASQNPEALIRYTKEQIKSGKITSEQGEQIVNNINGAKKFYDNLPKTDANGKPFDDIQKSNLMFEQIKQSYLENKLGDVSGKEKQKIEKDLADTQDKIDEINSGTLLEDISKISKDKADARDKRIDELEEVISNHDAVLEEKGRGPLSDKARVELGRELEDLKLQKAEGAEPTSSLEELGKKTEKVPEYMDLGKFMAETNKPIEEVKPIEVKAKVEPVEVKAQNEPTKEPVIVVHGTGDNGFVLEHNEGIDKKGIVMPEDVRRTTVGQEDLTIEEKNELNKTGSLVKDNEALNNGDKKVSIFTKHSDSFGRSGGSRFDIVIPENNSSTAEGVKDVLDKLYDENLIKNRKGSEYIKEAVKRVKEYIDSNKTEAIKEEVKAEGKPEVKSEGAQLKSKRAGGVEPELPKGGTTVVTETGLTEKERQDKIEERKRQTKITEEVDKRNKLVQDTKSFYKHNKRQRNSSEGLRELNRLRIRARELGLEIDDRLESVIKKTGARRTKIKYNAKAEGDATIVDGKTLYERDSNTQKVFKELHDSGNILDFKDEFGTRLSDAQIDATIQDILDGIPSKRANRYLDKLEEAIKNDEFPIYDKGLGEYNPTYKDLMNIEKEVVGEPMDEVALNKFLNEESNLTPEQEQQLTDNIENLLHEYETEPQTGVEGEIQQTKPASKEGITAETKPIAENAGEVAKTEKKLEKAYKDLTNIEKRQIINSKFDKLLEELKIEKICPTD